METGSSLSFSGSRSIQAKGMVRRAWRGSLALGVFASALLWIGCTDRCAAQTSAGAPAAPIANAGGPYTGTVDQPITFTGAKSTTPAGQTLSYAWDFGDGSTGTGVTPTHSYAASGKYTSTLTVADPAGASASATVTVTIDTPPVAVPGGPYSGTTGAAVAFSGAKSKGPSGQTLKYAWSFGDGGIGTGAVATHIYKTAGTYAVSLTVTDAVGGGNTALTTAVIAGETAANTGGTYNGLPGEAIKFSGAKSTGPAGKALTYAWKFGDGASATGEAPSHSYSKAGSYTVSLTVTDPIGGSNTATTTATISAGVVANTGGPYISTAGSVITFSGKASTGPAEQALTYAWDFGDGDKGTGPSPTHTYTKAGNFTVSLSVTATAGSNSAKTTATIDTETVANAGGPYSGAPTEVLTFNASKSTAPKGQSLTYAWTFGDGSKGTGENPTHAYKADGNYTVSLTVTDGVGGKNTVTAKVTIANVAAANPGGPYIGGSGEAIQFSGAKSIAPKGKTLRYAWSFGDGSKGTGETPIHGYAKSGTYTVSLTVSFTGGKPDTATTTVTISGDPVANAGGPYNERPGSAISFNGSKSSAPKGQTITFAWNFGDGSKGTSATPTHSYKASGTYTVSLTVTGTGGGTATSATLATVASVPTASAGGPYGGAPGQVLQFSGAKSAAPANGKLTYAWSFGDGASGSGVSPTHSYANVGAYTVKITVIDSIGGTASANATANIQAQSAPAITGFSPNTGPVGTAISVEGTNFTFLGGLGPRIVLQKQGGGTLTAPVSGFSATSLSFVIPPGTATGAIEVSVGPKSATSSSSLSITTSSNYSVSVSPATVTLIQGQSAAVAVAITTTNSFSGIAALSVKGLPSGVTASFQPTSITVGQTGTLTLTAPSSQVVSTNTFTVTAAATIQGQAIMQTGTASLQVTAITTSFLGRAVVDDAEQEPIAGVAVKFQGVDDKGNSTGCSGQTVSDGGGNFQLTNLPAACVGPQLIAYNGSTATAPAGKYAGVNLSYTLVSGQVVASPVLIHLPRIDNAETVEVAQNSTNNQIFYFQTIPGLKVTVYAGTTLTLDDGTQPNPFPLTAIDIPLDRLPDQIPTSGMLTPFIVAFQPANAVSSLPVEVDFPNSLGVAPGTNVTFVTLDPTHGYMVPYGTGTVSADGREFTANPDPSHPGHNYGLVHFDWHGPLGGPPPGNGPPPGPDEPFGPEGPKGSPPRDPQCPDCLIGEGGGGPEPLPSVAAGPVDLSSGIVFYTHTDLKVSSARGSIAIHRYYRTLDSNAGPFGVGTSFDYSYGLDVLSYVDGGQTITFVTPNGSQFPMSMQPNGTFANSQIPRLRGAVLTVNGPAGPYILTWVNGTQYTFTVNQSTGSAGAFLTSVTDLNGNTTTIVRSTSNPLQILSMTDPVGRTITFTYGSNNCVAQATDPIGRIVQYTYNAQGTLATFTDANGGVTSYTYDSANNLATITDPRGIVTEQNTYNESFDGRVLQQIEADGGVYQFAYTLLNPGVKTSPVLQTVVTDPVGNQSSYRYNPQGFLLSATDATGQTRTLTRDPSHNNLVSAYSGFGVCPVCGDVRQGNVSFTFDQVGNELTKTDSLGNTTTYTYDTRFNKVRSVTDALNHTRNIVYDSNGNITSITDGNGNATQMLYDGFGEFTQIIDAAGNKTSLSYDAYGDATSVTDALGNVSQFTFDAVSRQIEVLDAFGRKSTTNYDGLNEITSRTDPLGRKLSYTYDGIGDMASLTDPRGDKTAFQFDSVGRLQSQTSALGGSESFKYDVDGNLNRHTDRRGQVSSFQYDTLNRLTQETYADATVTRTYDAQGRLLNVNDSVGGVFSFTYDSAGRLLTQGEPTGVVNYTHDALGRIVSRQVVGQAPATYTYDAAGNLVGAAMPSAGVTYTYDVRNHPTTLTRTNGVVTTYAYDAQGRVLSIVHAKGGAPLNTINYTYDPVGKRSIVSNDISQAFVTQSATGTVDAANELIGFGATSYTSDANGNRLTETNSNGKLTYAWDGRNRLVSITDASGNTTSMQYDFKRNLLNLTQNNGGAVAQQSFVVDSRTNVVSLTASTGTAFSVLTGMSIDSHLVSVDANGNALFGITDALRSTTSVADGTGKLASKFDYEPYGQTTGTPANGYPFGFTGRVPVLNGINYFRERYYDTSTGRFLSEDPIGFAGGSNLYAYAGGDPILLNDPTGESGTLDSPNIINELCEILHLRSCPAINPRPVIPGVRTGSRGDNGDDSSGDDSGDNGDDESDDGSFPDDGSGDGSRLNGPPAIRLTMPFDPAFALKTGTNRASPAAELSGDLAVVAASMAEAAGQTSKFTGPAAKNPSDEIEKHTASSFNH